MPGRLRLGDQLERLVVAQDGAFQVGQLLPRIKPFRQDLTVRFAEHAERILLSARPVQWLGHLAFKNRACIASAPRS